jgi:hypothetical protein
MYLYYKCITMAPILLTYFTNDLFFLITVYFFFLQIIIMINFIRYDVQAIPLPLGYILSKPLTDRSDQFGFLFIAKYALLLLFFI